MTQRSLEHFSIGRDSIPREMISAYAILKKAAATANHASNRLGDEPYTLIVKTCDEILAFVRDSLSAVAIRVTSAADAESGPRDPRTERDDRSRRHAVEAVPRRFAPCRARAETSASAFRRARDASQQWECDTSRRHGAERRGTDNDDATRQTRKLLR